MSIKRTIYVTLFMILFIPYMVNAESKYLYDVLKNESESNGLAREYTGEHHDSFTEEPSKKIYHWYASTNTEGSQVLDKNNVIFANHCWQMIRTTDTGGIKLLYNGEVENNQCLDTRGKHVGYTTLDSQNLASNYWYGTDYSYDSSTKTFKLSGVTEQVMWNTTTGPELIGKYTCKNTNKNATCSTLYLVESFNNNTNAYVIPLNSNSNYSQFGTLEFNASYNSPTYVGYMYGDVYSYSTTNGTTSESFTTTQTMLYSTSLGTSYWYADSIKYDYVLFDGLELSSSKYYKLVNPYQVSSINDYPDLVGKYTFRSSDQTYTSKSNVYYIAAVNGSNMYYKQLQSGRLLSAYEPIVFGDSITDNGNGTYTINNPTSVTLTDWYTDYASYKNKYTCNNSNTTCTNPRYTTATTTTDYTYINAGEKIMIGKTRSGLTLTDTLLVRKDELVINSSNYSDYKYTCNTDSATCTESTLRMISGYSTTGYNYAPNHYYGSSVTWDGTNYTLVDPIEIENYNNLNNISTHHYICVSNGLKTCQTVAYVYYYTGSGTMYYITLRDGVTTVSKALEDMLTKNTTNSTMKSGVDAWYKHYMLDYDDYIEDTIFCNDRSIRALYGWKDDGGMTDVYLLFKEYNVTSDLSCTNTTDRFSVSNPSATLTYKVGLMSSPEMNILNNSNIRKTGQYYWLASPYYFYLGYAGGRRVYSSGDWNSGGVCDTYGVRPAVSLKPNIRYVTGDGTKENPYIIDYNDYYSVNVEIKNETEDLDINIENMTQVEEGEEIIFKVTPINGYKLNGIQVIDDDENEVAFTETGVESQYKFTMPASNVTIIPSYKKNRFNVNVTVKNEEEDFDINVEDMTSVLVGESVIFKVTPITGYKVNSIQILDSDNHDVSFTETSNENEYSFVMPESDVTIIPSYEKVSSSIGVEESEHTKEITIQVNDVSAVVYEDTVKFTVVPEKGYEVDRIDITDKDNNKIDYHKTDNDNEYTFIMPASNVTIIPKYKKVSNSVKTQDNENTKELVIEVNDATAVIYEDTVKFTVIPEDGYEIEDIDIRDKNNNKIEYKKTDKDNEYTFIMPDTDVVIKPLYRKIPIKEENNNSNNTLVNPKTGRRLSLFILLIVILFVSLKKYHKIKSIN